MVDDNASAVSRGRAARATAKPKAPAAKPAPERAAPKPRVTAKPKVAAAKPAAKAPAKAPAKKPAAPRTRKPAAAPAAPPPVTAPQGSGTTTDAAAPTRQVKPPPEKLSVLGRQLWRDLNALYDFRPDEFVTLEDACRAIARVEDLRAELAGMDPMIVGSMGQLVVNPLYTEIRAHEAHISTLLGKLRLRDVAVQVTPKDQRSSSARAKAEQRWAMPHAHGTTA